jgi:hypothetical protein
MIVGMCDERSNAGVTQHKVKWSLEVVWMSSTGLCLGLKNMNLKRTYAPSFDNCLSSGLHITA